MILYHKLVKWKIEYRLQQIDDILVAERLD